MQNGEKNKLFFEAMKEASVDKGTLVDSTLKTADTIEQFIAMGVHSLLKLKEDEIKVKSEMLRAKEEAYFEGR